MTAYSPGSTRVGWIGAGRMGSALAELLLAAGYDVAVWNRTRAKAEELQAHGAGVVDRPAELADRDIVFTMVSASADLEAVTTGPDGLFAGGNGPTILVDSSTVSTEASAAVRVVASKVGSQMLAAPVSGNPKVVSSAQATLAVSGPRAAFDKAEPVLRALGRGVTYVGEEEVARLVKICHNVFLGVVIQSLAEITVLAEKGGVSRAAFLEFLNNLSLIHI